MAEANYRQTEDRQTEAYRDLLAEPDEPPPQPTWRRCGCLPAAWRGALCRRWVRSDGPRLCYDCAKANGLNPWCACRCVNCDNRDFGHFTPNGNSKRPSWDNALERMAANLKAHAAPAPQPKPPPKGLSMERRIPLGQHLAEAMAAASAASSSTSPVPKPPPQALLRRVGLAAPPPPVISKAPVARYHLHLALPVWAVPKSQLHLSVSQPDNSGADGPGAPQPWDDSLPSLPHPEPTQLLPPGDVARAPDSAQLGHTPLLKHHLARSNLSPAEPDHGSAQLHPREETTSHHCVGSNVGSQA